MMNTLPKQLQALQNNHPDIIESIEDRRDITNGYGESGEREHDGIWINFKPGWIDPNIDCHYIHEYSVKDCLAEWKHITPCKCDQCLAEIKSLTDVGHITLDQLAALIVSEQGGEL